MRYLTIPSFPRDPMCLSRNPPVPYLQTTLTYTLHSLPQSVRMTPRSCGGRHGPAYSNPHPKAPIATQGLLPHTVSTCPRDKPVQPTQPLPPPSHPRPQTPITHISQPTNRKSQTLHPPKPYTTAPKISPLPSVAERLPAATAPPAGTVTATVRSLLLRDGNGRR